MEYMQESVALKIYTLYGTTRENIFAGKKVLHLGCGGSKLHGAIGVDRLRLSGVDVVHDLDFFPWPFEDESIDVFVAHSVLEHIGPVPRFFEEVYRIGKNGARIVITVPYFRSVDAFLDSTHTHFFASHSLDYFLSIPRSSLSNYNYTACKFKKIGFWYGWPQPSKNIFVRIFKRWIEKHQEFYDQYLSLLFPMKTLVWELEVEK